MSRPQPQADAGRGEVLTLTSGGARLQVATHGAHALSWRTADGRERLFLSRSSAFFGAAAIRGGVPVIFPQFAGEGPLPKHGFARNRAWRFVDAQEQDNGAQARFALEDDEATRALWPRHFTLELEFVLTADSLALSLSVVNRDQTSFEFTAALHSYLQVTAVDGIEIEGLRGLRYRDTAAGGAMADDALPALRIAGEVDRIYFNAPSPVTLRDGDVAVQVESEGFADIVVWNPGAAKAASLQDLDADGWRRFVCIESAVIGNPVQLSPGHGWTGRQRLRIR